MPYYTILQNAIQSYIVLYNIFIYICMCIYVCVCLCVCVCIMVSLLYIHVCMYKAQMPQVSKVGQRRKRRENTKTLIINYIPLGTQGFSEILYCLFRHSSSFSQNHFLTLSSLKFLSVLSKSSKKDIVSVLSA